MKDPPRVKREVQRRARRIMDQRGLGYGKAMKRAGWMVPRCKKRLA